MKGYRQVWTGRMLDRKADRFKVVKFSCARCASTQTLAVPVGRIMVACIDCHHVQRPKEEG